MTPRPTRSFYVLVLSCFAAQIALFGVSDVRAETPSEKTDTTETSEESETSAETEKAAEESETSETTENTEGSETSEQTEKSEKTEKSEQETTPAEDGENAASGGEKGDESTASSEESDGPPASDPERQKARQVAIADAAGPGGWLERSWTWDLNVELGLSRQAGATGSMGRVRSGIVRIVEPNAFTLGVMGEVGSDKEPALGLQFEILSLHLGAFWQLGGLVDFDGTGILATGIGWQIFAVEMQYAPGAPEENRLMGLAKLRLPISWFIRGVTN